MDLLSRVQGFDWNKGNIEKNWEKHKVAYIECEEVFFNKPLIVKEDEPHSVTESRYYALGKTDTGRLLFMVFTIRGRKIRVISARDMNKKERSIYDEQIEKSANIQE